MTGAVPIWAAWLAVPAALIAHGGLMVAAYNRVNALAWPRWIIKSVTKIMLAFTLVWPIVLAAVGEAGWDGFLARGDATELPAWVVGYIAFALGAGVVVGLRWVSTRPGVERSDMRLHREVEVIDYRNAPDIGRTPQTRFWNRVPMNCHLELSVERFDLPVRGWPAAWDGYRIAHLSDVHLTGDIGPDLIAGAVDRATRWRPDAMVLTGDILDRARCADWIGDLFGGASATDGCRFILGNHDDRVPDPDATRAAMVDAGWIDVGGRVEEATIRGEPVRWIGNEAPWFPPPELSEGDDPAGVFRILVAHSPDQIDWARRRGVGLMFAGHTHGGQGRLPVAGPILSPSRHGSRFASGDFHLPPTMMHVTRGLAGVHPVRVRCRPELSLLTIRSVPRDP